MFSLWMHTSVWKTVLDESNALDVLMLLGADKEDHEKIAEMAQEVWLEVFTNSRGDYTVRGIQKKRGALVDTEKAFISSRRRALQSFVDSGASRQIADKTELMSGSIWTEKCKQEHEFNLAKQAAAIIVGGGVFNRIQRGIIQSFCTQLTTQAKILSSWN